MLPDAVIGTGVLFDLAGFGAWMLEYQSTELPVNMYCIDLEAFGGVYRTWSLDCTVSLTGLPFNTGCTVSDLARCQLLLF